MRFEGSIDAEHFLSMCCEYKELLKAELRDGSVSRKRFDIYSYSITTLDRLDEALEKFAWLNNDFISLNDIRKIIDSMLLDYNEFLCSTTKLGVCRYESAMKVLNRVKDMLNEF